MPVRPPWKGVSEKSRQKRKAFQPWEQFFEQTNVRANGCRGKSWGDVFVHQVQLNLDGTDPDMLSVLPICLRP